MIVKHLIRWGYIVEGDYQGDSKRISVDDGIVTCSKQWQACSKDDRKYVIDCLVAWAKNTSRKDAILAAVNLLERL